MPGRRLLVMLVTLISTLAHAQDRIVLERNGFCFGMCPTYRLEIDDKGLVTFTGDKEVKTRRATRQLSPLAFSELVDSLKRAGFFELDPHENSIGHAGCTPVMTDQSGGGISVLQRGSTTAVAYYDGCRGEFDGRSRAAAESAMRNSPRKLILMNQLSSYIDSVAGTDEWVKPTVGPRTKPIHHFVWFANDREEIRTDTLFLNTKEIEGAQILYFWKNLETDKDQYDFSAIKSDIEFLHAHGKKLWIQLQDVTFSPKRYPVPKYLLEDSTYHGGAAMAYMFPDGDEAPPQPGGWVARRWDPAVRERFQKLLFELGKEFDGKIAGINLPETAMPYGSSGKYFPPGFTFDSYREAIAVNLRALKLAFPKSVAMQYANFMPGEWRPTADKHYLSDVYSLAESIGAGVGGPDLMPYRVGHAKGSHPLLRRSANRIPTGLAVQDGNLAEVNPLTKQKVTAADLLDYAYRDLRLDYVFWGREEPYYSKEVIPLLRR